MRPPRPGPTSDRVSLRLRIRAASATDAEAVLRLWTAVLAEGRWFLADPDEPGWTVEAVEADLARLDQQANSRVLLAWRGDLLEGACWLRGERLRRLRHVARLELVVAEAARGRGVGRRLLAEAVAWAEGQPGLRKLSLSVMADNPRAIALYERAGFVVEGRRAGEVQEADGTLRDDILMAREVDARPSLVAELLRR